MSSVAIPRLLTVTEAAEFLGRGVNTLYIDCRAGLIPHYRIGNSLRFDLDQLKTWLQENRRGPKVGVAP